MIMYSVQISCDICLDKSVTVPGVSEEVLPLPKGWRDTVNRTAQTTDKVDSYCLAGIRIICDTCHEKLMALRDQIRKESAPCNDADQAGPPEKHSVTAILKGRDIHYDGMVWRYSDTAQIVPASAQAAIEAATG